ncbi:MAG TPA: SdrD B-like domain-containing protein, partial [Pyrinomonadaceae bacterium]|nr:SdrD B-like domain-containing protein [Pyrinomonadaceae bacterium]
TVRTGAQHSSWELSQVDYEYNFNRYNSFSNQSLTLSAQGRAGDGRFFLLSNLNKAAGQSNSSVFRNGTLTFERPNGQKFVAGDFGTGTDLQFLSANIRGASAQTSFSGFRATTFGGRSISGAFFSLPEIQPVNAELPEPNQIQTDFQPRGGFQYDTNIYGVYATKDFFNNKSRRANPLTVSSGVMRFSNPNRSGETLAGSLRYGFERVRLQGDAAIGKFSGINRGGIRTEGFGAALDVSASFQLFDNLNLQGRYAYTSAKFFSPQSGSNEPVKLMAGGANWQPKKWLTASLSGSMTTRPDDNSQRYSFVTGTVNLTPGGWLPTVFLSHTESKTPQFGNSSFTLLNAAKNFSRFRLFMNATRIKTINSASQSVQIGSSFRVNESNSLEVSQSLGSGGTLGGIVNWQSSSLFTSRLSLSAGFGYNRGNNSSLTVSERLSANIRLPGQTSLQVTYLQTNAGPTLLVGVRGSLFRKRKSENAFSAPVWEMNSYSSFSGRVYQDVNLNGQYDAGVDKPQASVKVRVDGNRYVESDANGLFRIDGVKTGEHQVYLDLLSVRADLTLLDGAQQRATLVAGRDSIVDFRLARTGRIAGSVWFDANENGKFDENEQPLADVRLVAANGRDTLTDANGSFVIGDLPPGEYVILLDEKTLPEKTKTARPPLAVKVQAGRETGDTNFAVIAIPAEVKRFVAKAIE